MNNRAFWHEAASNSQVLVRDSREGRHNRVARKDGRRRVPIVDTRKGSRKKQGGQDQIIRLRVFRPPCKQLLTLVNLWHQTSTFLKRQVFVGQSTKVNLHQATQRNISSLVIAHQGLIHQLH